MRLINVTTYKIEEFMGANIPRYVILSHVWDKEEVTFQDMANLESARRKKGYTKIRYICHQAVKDGVEYAWVDTCCINKRSSAELSEAINSMFNWYKRSKKCYAYLGDLELREWQADMEPRTNPVFKASKWFTRGWTLQELIAPYEVFSMDKRWQLLGCKTLNLLSSIAEATNIDDEILKYPSRLHGLSIAKRMSWAANRKTLRKEDEAYCLFGIFDINMPLLYGEEEQAFTRLQEELYRRTIDHSLLVHGSARLLAHSPADFAECGHIEALDDARYQAPFELTNLGLRTKFPIVKTPTGDSWAVLNCSRKHRLVVLCLQTWSCPWGIPLMARSLGHSERIESAGLEMLLGAEYQKIVMLRNPSVDYLHYSQASLWYLTSSLSTGAFTMTADKFEPPSAWTLATPDHPDIKSKIPTGRTLPVHTGVSDRSTGNISFVLNRAGAIPELIALTFELKERRRFYGDPVVHVDLKLIHHTATGPQSRSIAGNSLDSRESSVRLVLPAGECTISATLENFPTGASMYNDYLLSMCLEDRLDELAGGIET